MKQNFLWSYLFLKLYLLSGVFWSLGATSASCVLSVITLLLLGSLILSFLFISLTSDWWLLVASASVLFSWLASALKSLCLTFENFISLCETLLYFSVVKSNRLIRKYCCSTTPWFIRKSWDSSLFPPQKKEILPSKLITYLILKFALIWCNYVNIIYTQSKLVLDRILKVSICDIDKIYLS